MDQFLVQIFAVIHQIPHGKIASYGEIAKMAGYPGYARHVGKALSRLPEGSTLPWHRVTNAQGQISLKGDDLLRQKRALIAEGVQVSAAGKVSMKEYRWQP